MRIGEAFHRPRTHLGKSRKALEDAATMVVDHCQHPTRALHLIEHKGRGQIIKCGQIADHRPSPGLIRGPAEPGAGLTVDAVRPAVGTDHRHRTIPLRERVPLSNRQAVSEINRRAERGVKRERADHRRLAVGIGFEEFVDEAVLPTGEFEVIEHIPHWIDLSDRLQHALDFAVNDIGQTCQSGKSAARDRPYFHLRHLLQVPPEAPGRHVAETEDFPWRVLFQKAIRIRQRKALQGLAQTTGALDDDRHSETLAKMKHLLVIERLQATDDHHEPAIDIGLQPTRQCGNVRTLGDRLEFSRRLEDDVGKRELLLEFDIEVQRAISGPGRQIRSRMRPEHPRLLDRLRCSSSPETRGTIGGDRDQRPRLVMRLDHCGQQLSGGGATGGYDRTGR